VVAILKNRVFRAGVFIIAGMAAGIGPDRTFGLAILLILLLIPQEYETGLEDRITESAQSGASWSVSGTTVKTSLHTEG
jgi:hypothetical protein